MLPEAKHLILLYLYYQHEYLVLKKGKGSNETL